MLDAFVERQTQTARGNQVLIALRLLLATVSLTVLVTREYDLLSSDPSAHRLVAPLYLRPPGLVAVIVCMLTILYVLAVRRSVKKPGLAPRLAFLQVFVDIFLISALVWNTNGVDSQFIVLYLISISAAAFVLKWNVALMAATVSAILFCVVAILYNVGAVPHAVQTDPAYISRLGSHAGLGIVRFLLLPVCAFFLTGWLAGTLSRRLAIAWLLRNDLLEGIGEGILLLDRDRRAVYHNRVFKRMLSLTDEPENVSLERMLGASVDQTAQEVMKQNAPRRVEISYRRPDGAMGAFNVRLIPIADLDGRPPHGVILALDDISAERKMDELVKHKQRIETMSYISANIAHEIRNPLASIRGAVQELVRSMELPEHKKELLAIVISESDRLDQIISDFLHFARMRAPGLVSTDLDRLFSDVKFLLLARPEAAGIEINIHNDVRERITVDPEQLKQVLLNLGVNAIQAMEHSPRKQLTVRATTLSFYASAAAFDPRSMPGWHDRSGVLIEVEDTGEGIPDSNRGQIFEPFFTTKPSGTGLGLAIIERVIHLHEGAISVESAEGYGTTFSIWLPSDLKAGAVISGLRPAIAI